MRILITGATGFVGRHLAVSLDKDGHDVFTTGRYVSNRGGGDTPPIPGIPYRTADLLDPHSVIDLVRWAEPDIVVHLAMQSSVKYTFDHPVQAYQVGFMGTVNIVEALQTEPGIDLDQFLFASSVEVYGNAQEYPLVESLPVKPASPYGVAKAAAEEYLQYLHRARGFPATILRSANTYGRTRNRRFVVERTIAEMLDNPQGRIRMGDPSPVRDFLYIEDEVDAYRKIINSEPAPTADIYNTGVNNGTKIQELVDLVADLTGFDGTVEWNEVSDRPLEIDRLVADYSKLKDEFGWEPTYSLKDGLQATIRHWETNA